MIETGRTQPPPLARVGDKGEPGKGCECDAEERSRKVAEVKAEAGSLNGDHAKTTSAPCPRLGAPGSGRTVP